VPTNVTTEIILNQRRMLGQLQSNLLAGLLDRSDDMVRPPNSNNQGDFPSNYFSKFLFN